MDKENFASYEPSSFAINATNLEFDQNGMIVKEDFPALIHEWWHYIQDISTITGQNGFYLWLRDIVRMTQVTCCGNNKKITIPLSRDAFDEVYSKYRRLYNIFCGEKTEKDFEHPKITKEPTVIPNGISFDGEQHTFAKCGIEVNNENYYFGLIALQEINAFYAQKIAEEYVPNVTFNTPTDKLPYFPYKMGDLLFDYYKISCDLRTRFIITTRVLDSLQAPAVFLYLLKKLEGKSLQYPKDKIFILKAVDEVSSKHSYPNSCAINEWWKDYNNWLRDNSHVMLRESLSWYLTTIGLADRAKSDLGADFFEGFLSDSLPSLQKLYGLFPTPIIKKGEELYGQSIVGNNDLTNSAKHDFDNAMVIWSHRRIYDLLSATSVDSINKNSCCPMYNEGDCMYMSKYSSDKKYDCKTAPWMVIKGEKQALCPYSVAAHSMGLWQNDLDIDMSSLTK